MKKDIKLHKFISTIIKEFLNDYVNNGNEFIGYHSTNSKIDNFDFNKIEIKPNSSTRIDEIFFSNIPQTSWGKYIYIK